LWVLLAAVGLLFAAAIGNVANMQLAQAAGRSKEVAIRAAIGAGAGRLARQLFVETAFTSIAGGLLGLLLTATLLRLAPAMLPSDFPRINMVRIDAVVLVSVFLLIALVTIATGLLPVRLARRLAVRGALSEDGAAGLTLTSPVARSRALIITAQVAIAAVLLVGAALLSRSFVTLLKVDRGYEPSHLMTARVLLPGTGNQPSARKDFFDALLARLRGMSGVSHAGLSNALPLTAGDYLIGFSKHANPQPGDTEAIHATLRPMTSDYFNAVGMRVLEGRGFSESDTVMSEPVVLVNRTFERANFTGSAIGQTLPAGIDDKRPDGTAWRIVGVVDDVRHRGATEPVQPEIYPCMCQITDGPTPAEYVSVRTTGDPADLARGFRELVRGLNPNAIVEQTMTMEERLLRSLARPRLYAVLLGGFAVFALLISGIGLFGGLSYGVTQRTREIGLRSALGATPGEIVLLIVRQGLTVAGAGLAAGIVIALLATRVLSGFLYGVATRDTASFAGVSALLLLTSIVACAIPARRAARIDVVRALKR
jgi:predicted permease